MDAATGDLELNGKFYSLSYENNVLSFDSKKVVSDGGMQSGRYYFDFTFRAARRGIYPTPPVQGECMYEPEILGRSDGYLFVIK